MRGISHAEDFGWAAAPRIPLGAAALIAGGSALSAGSSLLGSGKASSAAKDAANANLQMFAQTNANLAPFRAAGQEVLPSLTSVATGSPTGGGPDFIAQAAGMQPGTLTEAQLEAVPGYRFIRDQGLKSTQSAVAARGLGVSGAALKGAAQYATGLADQTYTNAFNQQQQKFANVLNLNTAQQGNLQNQYNRLAGVASLGSGAAATTGKLGATAAASEGNYINQAGLANAAGTQGVGSAITGGINSYLGYNALQNFLNPTGATGGYVDNTSTFA